MLISFKEKISYIELKFYVLNSIQNNTDYNVFRSQCNIILHC